MSRIPLLGTQQLDARLDGTPHRVRSRALWSWRAWDGLLAPLTEGLSVAYRGRTSAATVHATDGTAGTLAASAPAWTSIDWDGDGSREDDGLLLSAEEALRYYDATTGRVRLAMGALTLRLDGIESGNATTSDAPYWSLTTDAITGAYLALLGTGSGEMQFVHYNGSSTVASALPVVLGNRFSARARLLATGAVQLALVRNGGAEVVGTTSSANALAAEWGGGDAAMIRLNERGNSVRGSGIVRYAALFAGSLTRAQLLEAL
jgi:hypothetical protein